MKRTMLALAALALLAGGCSRRGSRATYLQRSYIMNVSAQFRAYGSSTPGAKELADEIFAEWERVSGEFSSTDPYSLTSVVNKRAASEWVPVTDEFLRLLQLGLDYSRLSGGAFDITFAPLYPIWREAGARKKLPRKEDIEEAMKRVGYRCVEVDAAKKAVHFTGPVQINLGALVRPYCFERAYKILGERAPSYPVQLRLGANMLAYGDRTWRYRVPDPFNHGDILGMFAFDKGLVISSSGRDQFTEIEGTLYSHLLDLRTGYPIKDYAALTVYYPGLDGDNFMSSAALAVMGREKAFRLLEGMKGTAALWVDDKGRSFFLLNRASGAKWREPSSFWDRLPGV